MYASAFSRFGKLWVVRLGRIWVLGFGFLGISLLWSVYDDLVPVLLQAGRPDSVPYTHLTLPTIYLL